MALAILVFFALIAALALFAAFKSLVIIHQGFSGVVERLGKYRITLDSGPHLIVPFLDRVAYRVDQREQVVSFPPQGVITSDNLVVEIDTVIYYTINDAVSVSYVNANYMDGIHQLTVATLRNIIGGMTLEEALTNRDRINSTLSQELDAATGQWGVKVARVELKAIDPPASIIDAMEKQMRAERDKRAAILTAEGERQAAILTAEGAKQAAILKAEGLKESAILAAEGDKQAAILKAQGEGNAIETIFEAIHNGNADQKLLTYQYLQTLPKIAQGPNASTWIIPAEITKALGTLGGAIGDVPLDSGGSLRPAPEVDFTTTAADTTAADAAVQQAINAAHEAESGPNDIAGGAPPPNS